ncbi:hypothetical protein BDZ97DRAFT_814116 [Flammula alnicola]|nr:hypothetical protein BDZ97DRAFT_814116 [Flammula alnicola]
MRTTHDTASASTTTHHHNRLSAKTPLVAVFDVNELFAHPHSPTPTRTPHAHINDSTSGTSSTSVHMVSQNTATPTRPAPSLIAKPSSLVPTSASRSSSTTDVAPKTGAATTTPPQHNAGGAGASTTTTPPRQASAATRGGRSNVRWAQRGEVTAKGRAGMVTARRQQDTAAATTKPRRRVHRRQRRSCACIDDHPRMPRVRQTSTRCRPGRITKPLYLLHHLKRPLTFPVIQRTECSKAARVSQCSVYCGIAYTPRTATTKQLEGDTRETDLRSCKHCLQAPSASPPPFSTSCTPYQSAIGGSYAFEQRCAVGVDFDAGRDRAGSRSSAASLWTQRNTIRTMPAVREEVRDAYTLETTLPPPPFTLHVVQHVRGP